MNDRERALLNNPERIASIQAGIAEAHAGKTRPFRPFRWRIVTMLDSACERTHFITGRRPWLWAFRHCPLAKLAVRLDERWDTGVWGPGVVVTDDVD